MDEEIAEYGNGDGEDSDNSEFYDDDEEDEVNGGVQQDEGSKIKAKIGMTSHLSLSFLLSLSSPLFSPSTSFFCFYSYCPSLAPFTHA